VGRISVAIGDTQAVRREAVESVFRRCPVVEAAASAGTPQELISICRWLRPAIVVLEPPGFVDHAHEMLHHIAEDTRLVLYPATTPRCYKGFAALRPQLVGGAVTPGDLLRTVLRQVGVVPEGCLGSRATARELQVLELAQRGLTVHEIAEVALMSEGTVKTHLRRLYEKLGARNRTSAITEAVRRGWIAIS
jgi:DNA-binding NarL/FixJ family response regulator